MGVDSIKADRCREGHGSNEAQSRQTDAAEGLRQLAKATAPGCWGFVVPMLSREPVVHCNGLNGGKRATSDDECSVNLPESNTTLSIRPTTAPQKAESLVFNTSGAHADTTTLALP